MKKYSGEIMLFLAAFIWGSSFVVLKNAVDFLTPAVVLFLRCMLASLFLTIMFYKRIKAFPKYKVKYGLLTGVCLFFAYFIQTHGLALTTPGKNAFLTAIYSALVPFLVWIVYKKRPEIHHFIAAVLCIVGIAFISLTNDFMILPGDMMSLIAGILFAVHFILINLFSKNEDGYAFTALQFYGATIMALLFSLLFEDMTIVSMIKVDIYLQLFYLSFFATAVCMLFQTIGQQLCGECKASIIISMESVFGVLFSVLIYKEVVTTKMIFGFILIFIAVIISQSQISFHKVSKKLNYRKKVFKKQPN